MALLEELQESWSKDSIFNEADLGSESLQIASLHQKYHIYYNKYKLILEDEKCKLKRCYREKWLWYSGKKTDENNQVFDLKVLKGDLNTFLDSDEDIQKIESPLRGYNDLFSAFVFRFTLYKC